MGACECENPMEFGYEVNSLEKENTKENEKKEYFSKFNYLNYKNNNYNSKLNYQNFNRIDNDLKNIDRNTFEINIEKNPSENDNINNSLEDRNISEEKLDYEIEGVNALKSRMERGKEEDKNNPQYNDSYHFSTTVERPKDDFSAYIFDNINKIRDNPKSFIKVIEQAKKNIILDQRGIYIYKSNVKVALSRGLPAFDDAINCLKKLNPMQKLIFSNELLIESPVNEEQIKDKKYMSEQINLKVQSGIPIKSFWRDIIKDSQTCLILMIVDDTGENSGKKRNDILDPNMQCIGIVSKKIGKSFASYITLC